MEEPRKRGSKVRDADGHIWRRGTTKWTCQAKVGTYYRGADGRWHQVQQVGRLPWGALSSKYGPLSEVAGGDG